VINGIYYKALGAWKPHTNMVIVSRHDRINVKISLFVAQDWHNSSLDMKPITTQGDQVSGPTKSQERIAAIIIFW